MSWFVYILRCADSSFYTGITWNLKKRIGEHNRRIKTPLQKSRVPVRLEFWQKFLTRVEAAKREKEMKPLRPWKDGVSFRETASFLPASSSPVEGRGIRRSEIKGWSRLKKQKLIDSLH